MDWSRYLLHTVSFLTTVCIMKEYELLVVKSRLVPPYHQTTNWLGVCSMYLGTLQSLMKSSGYRSKVLECTYGLLSITLLYPPEVVSRLDRCLSTTTFLHDSQCSFGLGFGVEEKTHRPIIRRNDQTSPWRRKDIAQPRNGVRNRYLCMMTNKSGGYLPFVLVDWFIHVFPSRYPSSLMYQPVIHNFL